MCGRYSIASPDQLGTFYFFEYDWEAISPNYNAAPGQNLPVAVRDNSNYTIREMRWGLIPHWAKDKNIGYKMINARAETILDKPTWKGAVRHHRCLVPANGFYEWQKTDSGKVPFFIHPKDRDMFSFAGVFSEWTDIETGEILETFSIITTSANDEMKPIHDRMPVMLHPDLEKPWLDDELTDENIPEFLLPYDKPIDTFEVSKDVGNVKNNNPELMLPVSK